MLLKSGKMEITSLLDNLLPLVERYLTMDMGVGFLNLKQLERLMEKERRELNRMADLHGLKDERVLDKSFRLDRIMDKYLHTKRAVNRNNQAHS
jgi:hypothetical protein